MTALHLPRIILSIPNVAGNSTHIRKLNCKPIRGIIPSTAAFPSECADRIHFGHFVDVFLFSLFWLNPFFVPINNIIHKFFTHKLPKASYFAADIQFGKCILCSTWQHFRFDLHSQSHSLVRSRISILYADFAFPFRLFQSHIRTNKPNVRLFFLLHLSVRLSFCVLVCLFVLLCSCFRCLSVDSDIFIFQHLYSNSLRSNK